MVKCDEDKIRKDETKCFKIMLDRHLRRLLSDANAVGMMPNMLLLDKLICSVERNKTANM